MRVWPSSPFHREGRGGQRRLSEALLGPLWFIEVLLASGSWPQGRGEILQEGSGVPVVAGPGHGTFPAALLLSQGTDTLLLILPLLGIFTVSSF